MKKIAKVLILALVMMAVSATGAGAQIPIINVVTTVVKKVIKAMDLEIQRQQNKVIWLQNAQKTLENTLSKTKLGEIGDWVQKQKDLYKDYYDELAKVKAVITYYQRIKDITARQIQMVEQYRKARTLFGQDKHLSPGELTHIAKVHTGIIEESVKNLELITTVLTAYNTTMTDAKRLELINRAADKVEENCNDMSRFNQETMMLSLQRAKEQKDVDAVKKMYGL